ncbi:MAG: branched-chain amino acid ABC transporter permease [Anaerolineales bacterium]
MKSIQYRDWLNQKINSFELNPYSRILTQVLVFLAFAIIPVVIHSNYWIRVFDSAGIYIMMALGLNVILGYTGLLNLGYAAYYAIGAYMWAILGSPFYGIHWNFWVVFILAGLAAGIAGYLLAIPGLGLKGDYLALVTIGFGESIRILANNLNLTNAAMGISQIDPMTIGPFKATEVQQYYYVLLVICVIEIILMRRLENSRIGNAWMAVREDELAAESMGLDTHNLKLLACFIGAIPAGMAGVMFAAMQTYVSPVSFKFVESITIVAMVIVGGRANVYGAVLGALLLVVVPEPLRGSIFDSARILIYGLLLIVMMLYKPQGFLPRRYRGKTRLISLERRGGPSQEKVSDSTTSVRG